MGKFNTLYGLTTNIMRTNPSSNPKAFILVSRI